MSSRKSKTSGSDTRAPLEAISTKTIDRVRALDQTIRSKVEGIEHRRGLPPELLAALRSAGCFRLFSPSWRSGAAHDYPDAIRVIESVAQSDGSTGWFVSQMVLAQIMLGYLNEAVLKHVYADSPDLLAAGVFAPKGRIEKSGANWIVNGRWPFATGCEAASWIYLHCMHFENRRVETVASGLPRTIVAVLPVADVHSHGNWDSLGLCGTGSHDVSVRKVVCADEWTFSIAESDGGGEGIHRVSLAGHAGLLIAAVAIGIAAGALNETVAIAVSGRRPTFSTLPSAKDPRFQTRLGAAQIQLDAARALLYSKAGLVQEIISGSQLDSYELARMRATPHHVVAASVAVVQEAFQLAGMAALARTSSLRRRWRDIQTATQHAWNSPDFLTNLGAARLEVAE